MKKLLSIIGAIALVTLTSTAVVACGFRATIDKNPPNDKTPDPDENTTVLLSTIIKIRDLGEMRMSAQTPTHEEILDRIDQVNEIKLDREHVKITDIFPKEMAVMITANKNSEKYTGQVYLTYKKAAPLKQELSKLINITDLGELKTSTPTSKEIFDAIDKINKIELDREHAVISDITSKSATITANKNSEKYTGQVSLTFSPPKPIKKDLSTLIEITSLGTITATKEDIKEKLISAVEYLNNIYLYITDIDVLNITNESAIISAKENSKRYTGTVTLTYTFVQKALDLRDLVKNLDLGEIKISNALEGHREGHRTIEIIVNKINEVNPGINLDHTELMIFKYTTITIIDGKHVETIEPIYRSKKYMGSIKVTYTIKPQEKIDIKEYVKETKLDYVRIYVNTKDPDYKEEENANRLPSEVGIIKAITEKNIDSLPYGLNPYVDEFDYEINRTSATITVKPNSKWFVSGSLTFSYQVQIIIIS